VARATIRQQGRARQINRNGPHDWRWKRRLASYAN
jgi:hypothetical protein